MQQQLQPSKAIVEVFCHQQATKVKKRKDNKRKERRLRDYPKTSLELGQGEKGFTQFHNKELINQILHKETCSWNSSLIQCFKNKLAAALQRMFKAIFVKKEILVLILAIIYGG